MTKPNEMDRVRAARPYLVDAQYPGRDMEQQKLDAFMAIFHPGHERIVLDNDEEQS